MKLTFVITITALTFLTKTLPAQAHAPLVYHGGRVLAEFRIYPLYYGTWSQTDINAQQNYLISLAAYMSGQNAPIGQLPMMWQYGVNSVSVAPYATDKRNPTPSALTKGTLNYLIGDNQSSHNLPPYSWNTLIVVFLATGFTLPDCNGCGAYHTSMSPTVFWAVVPNAAGQLVTAHEVFEAAANPAIDHAPAWDETVDGCNTTVKLTSGLSFPGVADNSQGGACSTTGYISPVKMAQANWSPAGPRNTLGRFALLENAVAGGQDYDQAPLYVCRGRRSDGSIQPGKFRQDGTDGCVIGYGGQQEGVKQFDFLATSWEGNVWDSVQSRWVYMAGEVPHNAVLGGYEASGEPLYYCRGLINGTWWQPGKIRPGFVACSIPYGGHEVQTARYQVLVSLTPAMPLAKVAASYGAKSPDAVHGGRDSDGEELFICTAAWGGGTHPGKLKPSFGACLISYAGGEIAVSNYQVLVTRWAASAGSPPTPTLPGGKDSNGETLYMCRARVSGTTTPGKFKPSDGNCYIGLGYEVSTKSFDLLTNLIALIY